jgi:uncharacterized protein (DUF302 family)
MSEKSPQVTYSIEKLSVNEIINRIEKILKEKGVTIFARISHSDAARQVG